MKVPGASAALEIVEIVVANTSRATPSGGSKQRVFMEILNMDVVYCKRQFAEVSGRLCMAPFNLPIYRHF